MHLFSLMGLIRNVFPPLVHPLKKSCNTQTSVKFDKTSTSNNLCSQSSATTLFPPSSLHADRLKKSKHTTFKSTGLGGLVTLFSSESNFSNDMLLQEHRDSVSIPSPAAVLAPATPPHQNGAQRNINHTQWLPKEAFDNSSTNLW